MRVILVDDEIPNLELLRIMFQDYPELDIIGAYSNPVEAWEAVQRNRPDVIFTDIEMPRLNGLELARLAMDMDQNIQVVFITAFRQYAIDAFELDAVHYLLKPVTHNGIKECLERLSKLVSSQNQRDHNTWTIKSFNGFDVFVEDPNQGVKWPTAKARELIAYLALNYNKTNDKWTICETLWPQMPAKRMEHNLHSTVNRARQALKEFGADDVLLREHQTYRLDVSKFYSEYIEFDTISSSLNTDMGTEQNKVSRLIELYSGPLYGTADFAWVDTDREHCETLYVRAMRHEIESCLESDLLDQAELMLQKLMLLDSCDEWAVNRLLRIYAKQGKKLSLVQAYTTFEDAVIKELNLKPSETTVRLYESLLAKL